MNFCDFPRKETKQYLLATVQEKSQYFGGSYLWGCQFWEGAGSQGCWLKIGHSKSIQTFRNMSICVAQLQTPSLRVGLLFVWRPIWLSCNYWPFSIDCGTTSSLSHYRSCHTPDLISKISIVKKQALLLKILFSQIRQTQYCHTALTFKYSGQHKNLWKNMILIPYT